VLRRSGTLLTPPPGRWLDLRLCAELIVEETARGATLIC
jgi:hypothetical protein